MTNGFDKATYKQRITHFTEELPFLSEEDKDWVMGKAILERLEVEISRADSRGIASNLRCHPRKRPRHRKS